MGYRPIEELEVYRRASALANSVYKRVMVWPSFPRSTLGTQLVRAVDSVSANLVEGDGRRSDADSTRFFVYSRASAREARHWIRTAVDRGLLKDKEGMELLDELTEVAKMFQGIIRARKSSVIREFQSAYGEDDPFCPNDPTT